MELIRVSLRSVIKKLSIEVKKLFKKMKFKSVLIAVLMFGVILPNTIFASSAEHKSPVAEESFDGSITDTIRDGSNKYKLQVLKSDGIGKYLADDQGMTLYYFTKDASGVSNCKDKCLEIWPPFHAENMVAPYGFNKSDFGTITREDGQKQTMYKGHPLYYFFKDKQVGDINGQGVNNVWFVLDKKIFEK